MEDVMKKASVLALALAFGLLGVTAAAAQRGGGPGTGPVAQFCQTDIEDLCQGKVHGGGEVRDCLEANKAKVSAECAKALDSTGFGRRRQ
jgi:hypothetical protein